MRCPKLTQLCHYQDREKELVQAVVKDGVVATTATATTAALNPATAAKVTFCLPILLATCLASAPAAIPMSDRQLLFTL